jgi:hypothetical protein
MLAHVIERLPLNAKVVGSSLMQATPNFDTFNNSEFQQIVYEGSDP